MSASNSNLFKLENGNSFPGPDPATFQTLLDQLEGDFALSKLQIAESAGVGAAMVLRVALGLSAKGATISAVVDDCFSGYVALATLRQLCNAGSNISIYTRDIFEENSDFGKQLLGCYQAGAVINSLDEENQTQALTTIEDSHALLFGIFGGIASEELAFDSLFSKVNELQTPVHTISCPPGVLMNGKRSDQTVFSATTICPGIQLKMLADFLDFAGRIYLTDISVTSSLYQSIAPGLINPFVSQPVIQIFPVQE